MQTLNNIINEGLAKIIEKPFLYLIKAGINPYIIFLFLIIIIFTFYLLLFYKGNFKIFISHFKKMPTKKRREWLIFLIGGLLIALVLYYNSLNLFYGSSANISGYSRFIDNTMASLGSNIMSFLEKIGVVK